MPNPMRFIQSTPTTPELIPPLEMPATPLRPYPERSRWPGRLVRLLLLVAVGLGAAEAVCWVRDDGAFPYLNVYVSDPVLGVRLLPGASTRVAFGGQRATEVRINGEGYRGGERAAPGGDEVLVVGDAQVFGLGVEEHEAFAARLGNTLGRPVVNAGVPTYGSPETRRVIEEQLAKRGAKTVVLAINLVDDLAEAQHPNLERHVAWDGWAVRKATAPVEITEFPGREWVYRRSHLWFALRRWRHMMGELDERGAAELAPSPAAAPGGAGGASSGTAPGGAGAASAETSPGETVAPGAEAGPLAADLRRVQQLVQGAGARLVVVLLPHNPSRAGSGPSLDAARALLELCRGLGVSVVDVGPVLAAVSGAYLDNDVLLAPSGHAAVAAELARVLVNAPP